MNETQSFGQSVQGQTSIQPTEAIIVKGQENRSQALVDILYLMNITWLYVFSLIYPLFGIIFGVIHLTGAISLQAKRIGKICLILGIINIVLSILILVVLIIFSRFFTNLIDWSL
jgi:hypothetical protein